ncbi:hypothetical protein LSS_16726 [Leptospira santarosai serovar Shermani str. LT 821]|uniref:Uncharacterized protein n=1 Tax=Leptospira santarosai serovar Shermani str. LT 821 TaxID=758847 RepID=K8XVP8_9LEPT|nr:hypothetical protein LSS_16726 [Leptospira santarosai serovar Shermani str. LT 821]
MLTRILKPIDSKISLKRINFFKKNIKFEFLKIDRFQLKSSKNDIF